MSLDPNGEATPSPSALRREIARRVAASLRLAPTALAARVELLLETPTRAAFVQLHDLEGEVLALVAEHAPGIDLTPALRRRSAFKPC